MTFVLLFDDSKGILLRHPVCSNLDTDLLNLFLKPNSTNDIDVTI